MSKQLISCQTLQRAKKTILVAKQKQLFYAELLDYKESRRDCREVTISRLKFLMCVMVAGEGGIQ